MSNKNIEQINRLGTKKRCNRFHELSSVVQEELIQEYFDRIENEMIARKFAVAYYTNFGANFDVDGLMSDPY